MTWAKFDDQYSDHPKVVAAGPWAELLDMRAIIFCAKYETDGHVPSAQLPRLSVGIDDPQREVATLVRVGRWTEDDDDGWWVHDFLDYHPSRDQQQQKRADARDRMRRVRANRMRTSSEQDAKFASGSPYPGPARPVTTPLPPKRSREHGTNPRAAENQHRDELAERRRREKIVGTPEYEARIERERAERERLAGG